MEVTVLDLGSNSFQLLQARCTRGGEVVPLFKGVEFVALATHLNADGAISPSGFELGVGAVKDLLLRAPPSAHKLPLTAVATSAVREAKNGREFLDAIERETGVLGKVITGEQEARLAYLGATVEFPHLRERTAVVDLGGGSTQIAVGSGRQVERSVSIRLGVLALVERLAASPNTANVALDHLAIFVRRTIEPSIAALGEPPEVLVFASGVARVIRDLVNTYEPMADGAPIQGFSLRSLTPTLLDATPEELAKRGVPEKRLLSVGPTAIVLDVIADLLGLDSFFVSASGLREGVALSVKELGSQRWPRAR
jgi:exopolyphosphatase/guanosine-5'-triphosphate,3'-diphosphate pyrophosphatase